MATQERALFWQDQIDAWQASSLSGQAFCKQQNLSYHQFVYWRRKQNRTQSDQLTSGTGYLWTEEAWLYLAVVIDLFSR